MLSPELAAELAHAHHSGKKVVFVSGVFDLLHQEHLLFLVKAKAAGDVLYVAIESDVRVRQLKGPGRPINTQSVRKKNLEQLGLVTSVFILPDDFSQPAQHRQLIAEIRPDLLAVSSHTAHIDRKKMIVEEYGGKLLIVHQHNSEISTSKLLAQHAKK